MTRRFFVILVATALVFAVFFGFQEFKAVVIRRALRHFSNQRQTVSITIAQERSWQPSLHSIGSLRARNGTLLSLDANGIIGKIMFRSGQIVHTGQILLELRSADERERLAALVANEDISRIRYNRDIAQFAFHGVSKATLQADEYAWKNATALVSQERFLIDKRTLRAPFSGRLGIRLVNTGQYLTPGSGIVELQSTRHMLVDFMLPQRDLSRMRIGDTVNAHVDAYPTLTFTGHISAINSLVDTTSRNVEVRAALNNQRELLLSGMFATIDITVGKRRNYITLPQTAIAYNSYGDTVYLIKNSNHGPIAQQHFIILGPKRGTQVAILSGIYPGSQVVTAGQMKLRNGTPVIINDQLNSGARLIRKPAMSEN